MNLDFDDPDHPELAVPDLTKRWELELEESVVAMALSAKQRLLACGTVEDAIVVLECASGDPKFRLAGHKCGTNGVAWLGGNTLVSVGEDGKARVWNVGRQACLHELEVNGEDADRTRYGHTVTHLTAAPDGRRFACAAGALVTLFTLSPEGKEAPSRLVLGPLASTVEALRFDRHGMLLACFNGGVIHWDLTRSKEERRELELPYPGACLSCDVSPRREWLVTGCHDSSLHIFHLVHEKDGMHVEELTCGGYDGRVATCDFDPTGRWLASSGGDKCTVWDFSGPGPAGSVPTLALGHQRPISCQAWQLDGPYLVTGGRDGRVYVFDPEDSQPMREGMPTMCLPGAMAETDGDEVTALTFGLNGLIYSGHISGFVRSWELPLASDGDEEEEAAEEQQEQPAAAEQQAAAAAQQQEQPQ